MQRPGMTTGRKILVVEDDEATGSGADTCSMRQPAMCAERNGPAGAVYPSTPNYEAIARQFGSTSGKGPSGD